MDVYSSLYVNTLPSLMVLDIVVVMINVFNLSRYLARARDQTVIRPYRWELVTVSHHHAKFGEEEKRKKQIIATAHTNVKQTQKRFKYGDFIFSRVKHTNIKTIKNIAASFFLASSLSTVNKHITVM